MAQTFASKSALSEAVALINSGQLDKAEAICRSAIGRNADDINMVALLGAILLKANQIPEAERYLRQAIGLAPSFAKPHEDLGHLLLEKGEPEEAAAILRKATRLDPNLDNAFFNLGKALAMLGEGREADEAFDKSFKLNPERKALALAAEHQKEGRWEEASAYRDEARKRLRSEGKKQQEARELAAQVETAVAQVALIEAGAVGLGALVTLVVTSSAMDITGVGPMD